MDGKVVIGVDLETKSFEKQIASLENKLSDIEASLEMASEDKTLFSTSEIREMEKEAEKLRNQLIKLYKQQADIGKSDTFKNMGKGLQDSIRKASKLVIAIFGIRSAYSAVRSAMSTLSQYDDDLANRIEYIRYILAYSLKPLIEGIVNLVYKLLGYINYIASVWFGKPLFDESNMDAFNKKLGTANKQAKELNKSLLGFDKINKLDSSSSGGASGGSGTTMTLPQGEVPSWIKYIADNKGIILDTLAGIASGLLAIKLGLTGIQALGIGYLVAGIVDLIRNLPEYFNKLDSSLAENGTNWEDFGDILDGISLIILGIGILTGNLPAVIIGACLLIVATVLKYWEDTKKILEKAEGWIWDKLDWLEEKIGIFGTVIKGIFGGVRDFIVDTFKAVLKTIKGIIDGILLIFKGDLKGGLESILRGIANLFIGVINLLIDSANIFFSPFRAILVGVGKILGKSWTLDNIKIPRVNYLAQGGIIVNRPGRGVPVGASAYAGEQGREGVLPLTNEASMSQLGYEIGKHVKVNADITLEIERRVLARVMKEIQNDSQFVGGGY